MKKMLTLALALVMAFTLAACGDGTAMAAAETYGIAQNIIEK